MGKVVGQEGGVEVAGERGKAHGRRACADLVGSDVELGEVRDGEEA